MANVLTIEQCDHVATLWLDDPERRNALGPAFWEELPLRMRELSDDPEVRVVVIAARGKHFTVGLDLKAFGSLLGGDGGGESSASDNVRRQRLLANIKRMQASITAVADCPKPVLAAVQGYCIGGGVDLITACDIRIASAEALFTVRETKLAIVADVGTLQRLPGIVAEGHLNELVYTGRDVTAARAREMGLVNEVFADAAALQDGARAMATEIATNSPLAVQGAKAVLRGGRGRSVAEGLDYVALWNTSFIQSNDIMEAMSAFMQKRPPKFTGT